MAKLEQSFRGAPYVRFGLAFARRSLRDGPRMVWRVRRDAAQTAAILAGSLSSSSNFVDVGANRGSMLELACTYSPLGMHTAFEPLPEMTAILRQRFPRVALHEVALADRSGSVTFNHVIDRPALSGMSLGKAEGMDVREIEVPVRQLDDLLAADYRVDVLKIDVEGAELGVLRGARRTIENSRPLVIFEHSVNLAPQFGTQPRMIWEYFDELKYRIYDLDGRPQTAHSFEMEFRSHRRFNWMAR